MRSFRKSASNPKLTVGEQKRASGHAASLPLMVLVAVCLTACAQPAVRPLIRTGENGLPRPTRITIGEFSAGESQVVEYQGIFRQQPSNRNPVERRVIAGNVSKALSGELAKTLQELGFFIEDGTAGTTVTEDILIIEGELIRIDEGDPLRRFIVGFGSGAARVETRVRVYQGSREKKLLEFTTDADSGKLPGAMVTAPAGAAAPPVISVGMLAGSAVATGYQNSADVTQLARSSADQAARYLSEFFVRQGWIRGDQVKKAKIAH